MNWLKYFKPIITLLLISAFLQAEISVGLGHTWSRTLQGLHEDNDGAHSYHQGSVPGRISLWYEVDSLDHHLFLDNDQVVYGIAILTEARYSDAFLETNRLFIAPLYATYYLNFEKIGIGAGLSVALTDVRNTRENTTLGQQIGKHLALRYNEYPWFIEALLMQSCAEGTFGNKGNEIRSFYDITNYSLRYGWYID